MIPKLKTPADVRRLRARSREMTSAALIVVLMTIWTGCAHYKVISADRQVRRVKAGNSLVAPVDGWFVPDARWQQMNEAIADRITELEKAP